MYEVLDDTATLVLLAIERGDSIRHVATRVQRPYETVRQAVNRLEDAGYVRYDDGLSVTAPRVREAALELVAASARVNPPSIEEAYVLPALGRWPYAFCRIDAVFVWTRGGYQVGRDPDDYPLFLAVEDGDLEAWEAFFAAFDIPTGRERQPATDGTLQVVLEPRPSLDIAVLEGTPVVPRSEAIEYMREHRVQFQPAFEILERLYEELDLDVENGGLIEP